MSSSVFIVKSKPEYYKNAKEFRPSENYPEYELGDLSTVPNTNYEGVRKLFKMMGLDRAHYGTKEWNPLGDIIEENSVVLIKPNLVQHYNINNKGGVECLYTQPSIVAPVIDYALKALKGTGKLIVGDAPMQVCNFSELTENSGYKDLIEYYRRKGFNVELVDFRKDRTEVKGRVQHKFELDAPSKIVDLGEESEFSGMSDDESKRLRIVNYPHDNLYLHHHGDVHQYCISQYLLDADVIINMPKPKTHKKAGITISLKNLVGINAKKDYLPHHRFGSTAKGGDEYSNKNVIQNVRGHLYDVKYSLESKHKTSLAQIVWYNAPRN